MLDLEAAEKKSFLQSKVDEQWRRPGFLGFDVFKFFEGLWLGEPSVGFC
jgi:hypothetical protein